MAARVVKARTVVVRAAVEMVVLKAERARGTESAAMTSEGSVCESEGSCDGLGQTLRNASRGRQGQRCAGKW